MTTRRADIATALRIATTSVPGEWPRISPRAASVDADQLDGAFGNSESAARLKLPGALAVTTGQQPGLFGGPMYVIHKALAARALARALESHWQRPVVPVFWLAGDDHDWDEATRTAWWSGSDEVIDWQLAAREPHAPQLPMSAEPLPPDVATARDRLADDLPPGEARDAALAWIDRHWTDGATIHSAYAGAITELFEPLGIATFDATSAAVKRAQRRWISLALERSDQVDAALATLPAADSRGAGQGETLVFIEAEQGRDRLIRDDEGFRTRRSGERFSHLELEQLLDKSPERFSANVLLRPVVEAALLPTVAYVAGPGELRYLTRQARVVYPELDLTPQAPVPRWGGVVVDAVTDRLLRRVDVQLDEILSDNGDLGHDVLRRDLPAEVPAAIASLDARIDEVASELAAIGQGIDPVLERAIESRRRRLRFVSDDLEQLMLRHHRKRGDVLWAQYRRLRNRVMPLGRPQERVIGVAAALGRWGDEWIRSAAQAADAWADSALDATVTGVTP